MRPRLLLLSPILLLVLLGPACSQGKSYSFPDVRIDATVDQDGSLSIVERRTFDFHGRFHFAYFTVEHRSFGDVEGLAVREGEHQYTEGDSEQPGTAMFEDNVLEGPGGFKYKATWWFDAKDERRTFTISYRVLCAVDLYADTAHLLWKFIGEGWSVPTASSVVTVHLPGYPRRAPAARPDVPCTPGVQGAPAPPGQADIETGPLAREDVRAWGHGPLHGEVRIEEPQTVVLSIDDLAPATFVEGSILFPAQAVPLLYQRPETGLRAVLVEEGRLADQANADRLQLLAEARRDRLWRNLGWLLFAVVVGSGPLAVAVARRRDRYPGVPGILEEPPEPDLHPAVLAEQWALAHRREGIRPAFRAQLLKLVRDGVVGLTPLGTVSGARDHQVQLQELPGDPLDVQFANSLFADADPVLLNTKPSPERAKLLREWREQVTAKAREGLSLHLGARRSSVFLWLLVLTSLDWSIPLAVLTSLPWWVPPSAFGITLATAVAGGRLTLRRLSDRDRRRLAEWGAFRRYLNRFSSLPDAPAAAVVIWEHHLVDAVALGVADRVNKQVRALIPMDDRPADWLAGTGTLGLGVFDAVHSAGVPTGAMIGVLVASGSSSSSDVGSFSSSSGSGGGFSGRGGGGGGGTGGGAG